jgi:cytochrome c oxidase cbb3-type subunit 3
MADEPKDQLRDHHFDGIQEYDNSPPRWWVISFWLSLVWAVGYIAWYHGGGGKLGADQLAVELAELAEQRAKTQTGPLSEEALRGLSTSPERIAAGAAIYAKAGCIACHGADGTGTVGPNLRDRYWIHGSSMVAIAKVLREGANNGQMPAQANLMSSDDLNNLTIYMVDLNRKGEKAGKAIDPAREKEDPVTY